MPAAFKTFLAVLFLCLPSVATAQGRPAAVSTALVDTRSVAETVAVFGEVTAGRISAVGARVGGIAMEVPVRIGDRVSKGDVLARIDTELLQIETERAEAEVEVARAGIAIADAQLDRAEQAQARAQRLGGPDVIERAGDYAAALGNLEQAMARLTSAEIAVREARYRLENATIFAPIDGIVLEVTAEVGQFIASGTEVATLIDTGSLEVEANVPARYISALDYDM
ncbi:MAG: efflux RND transporter periplasmic adaptor subunit, partial [Pseudomonadota bacterium]